MIYFAYFNMAEDLVISMLQETVLPRFSETSFCLTLSHDLLQGMMLQMVKKNDFINSNDSDFWGM